MEESGSSNAYLISCTPRDIVLSAFLLRRGRHLLKMKLMLQCCNTTVFRYKNIDRYKFISVMFVLDK